MSEQQQLKTISEKFISDDLIIIKSLFNINSFI